MSELVWAAIGVCLAFSFFNGFTDAAYSISTIIATRVLTPIKAVALAGVGNFVGLLFGKAVAETIGKGIITIAGFTPEAVALLVIAALLGGLLFDMVTWWFALPVSESHILIGGLVGAGVAAAGTGVVQWGGIVNKVLIPMVVSPLVGFAVAFLITVAMMHAFRKRSPERVNRTFAKVQVGSSFLASVMHGSNDGQKFVGIITFLLIGALWLPEGSGAPFWVLMAAFGTVSVGTLLGGWRIVKTLAVKITNLKPYQGVAAESGGALILAVTAATGSPVSTTHAFTAAIMGVGATRRLSAVRWGLARRIVLTWIITMPTAAVFAYGTFQLLNIAYGWVGLGAIIALVVGVAAVRPVLRRKALARDEALLAVAGGAPPT